MIQPNTITPPDPAPRVPLVRLAASAAPSSTLARIVRPPSSPVGRVAVAAFNSSV
ncbi:hypothetical protein ACWERY_16115 [Streptomyces sp. NPDC004082]|uniref:hypothetical protein n=1 Tax=unclassified Streptomyces TaxID=2593676 RepID=UPI0033B5714D